MSIKVARTPEGIVIRKIAASGERSYRKNFDGTWDETNHKGPWVRTDAMFVPGDVLKAFASLIDSGEIEMVR